MFGIFEKEKIMYTVGESLEHEKNKLHRNPSDWQRDRVKYYTYLYNKYGSDMCIYDAKEAEAAEAVKRASKSTKKTETVIDKTPVPKAEKKITTPTPALDVNTIADALVKAMTAMQQAQKPTEAVKKEEPKQEKHVPKVKKFREIPKPKVNVSNKQEEIKEEVKAEEPKVVEEVVETKEPVAEAAKGIGFDANNFVNQNQQQNTVPAGAITQPLINNNIGLPNVIPVQQQVQQVQMQQVKPIRVPQAAPYYDPEPQLSPQEKAKYIKERVEFIEGKHQVDVLQLNSLITLIGSPILKRKISEYGVENKAKLVEIDEIAEGFDFVFQMKCKDKKHLMKVYFNSTPVFNHDSGTWNNNTEFEKIHIHH